MLACWSAASPRSPHLLKERVLLFLLTPQYLANETCLVPILWMTKEMNSPSISLLFCGTIDNKSRDTVYSNSSPHFVRTAQSCLRKASVNCVRIRVASEHQYLTGDWFASVSTHTYLCGHLSQMGTFLVLTIGQVSLASDELSHMLIKAHDAQESPHIQNTWPQQGWEAWPESLHVYCIWMNSF